MSEDDGARRIARKKKRSRPAVPVRTPRSAAQRWKTEHLVVSLLVGLGIGIAGGYYAGGRNKRTDLGATSTQTAQPSNPIEPASSAPTTDGFGRPPTDEHFGHDHPTQQPPGAAPAAPVSGETDSFGRSPGSEHYGHSHP